MDLLLKLVVFLAIATSCNSYVYKRNEPAIVDTSPELKFDDDYYPTEYMEKLIAKLKPEKLKSFYSLVDLQHRVAIPFSEPTCSWFIHKYSPHKACDEFGECYYVSPIPKQEIEANVCNHTLGHECGLYKYDKHQSTANCCRQMKGKVTLIVSTASVKELQQRNYKNYEEDNLKSKEFYVKSICDCIPKALSIQDLGKEAEVCKRPVNDYY